MENSDKEQKMKPHTILVSLPLQGHLIPTVQLAIKLASKGFSITFINAENIHHNITRSNPSATANGGDIFAGTGLDIEYVTVSDGLPLEYDRSLNHDRWLGATMHCYPAHVEVVVAKVVKSRPLVSCLLADSYSVWASDLAKKFGLLHVSFWTEPALVLNIYFHRHLLVENGHVGPGARKDMIDYVPGVESLKPTDLTSYLQQKEMNFCRGFIFACLDDTKRADFILGNTVQELEAHAISAIKAHVPFYAIGPLFQHGLSKSPVATSLWAESDCIKWLDTKPNGSVLYISFGSYAHISKEELGEMAMGIKLSGVNFLWVLRPDVVSSDDPDPLPNEFRDEVKDKGMIVSWTCQMDVLSHPAVGGFLTHCGWNSILESIWYEIPLLCFPLLTDQFTNHKLIVDDWKIGYSLREGKLLTKEDVSRKIKLLIGDTMCYELKDNIKEVKHIVQNAIGAEGSSERNLDAFVKDLNAAIEKKYEIHQLHV